MDKRYLAKMAKMAKFGKLYYSVFWVQILGLIMVDMNYDSRCFSSTAI